MSIDPHANSTVDLFLFSEGGWQQIGIMSLSAAEGCIERGTGRLVAVDSTTRVPVAATFEADFHGSGARITCEWFARCTREATGTQEQTVLGHVPICDRCQAKYDALA